MKLDLWVRLNITMADDNKVSGWTQIYGKHELAMYKKPFKYTRYCIHCGKKFHTNDTRKVICGDWECEEKQRFELRRANCRKGKQK